MAATRKCGGVEVANTLTTHSPSLTVQHCNMIIEADEINTKGIIKVGQMPGFECENRVYSPSGICPSMKIRGGPKKVIEIRQATKQGTIPCKIGGVADLNYPDSTTRRGRVQGNGEICPTLTTENIPSVLEPWIWEIDGVKYLIRIRKLTPRECWRLMDFSDTDFNKAQEVNSNTQLYKQAGNSIVRNVLCEVFKQLL